MDLSKSYLPRIFTIALVVFAAFLLFFNIVYLTHPSFYWWASRDLVRSADLIHHFQTTAAELSYGNGARVPGGFMYYLWYLLLLVNPKASSVYYGQIFLFMASIAVLYFLVKRYYGNRAGIIAAIVYGTASIFFPWMYSAWNPGYVAIFAVGFFYFFYRAVNDDISKLKWATACIALCSQMHFSGMLLLFPLFASLIFAPKKMWRLKPWLAAIGVFLLCYSPYIVAEFINGFHNTRLILDQPQLEFYAPSLPSVLSSEVLSISFDQTKAQSSTKGWRLYPQAEMANVWHKQGRDSYIEANSQVPEVHLSKKLSLSPAYIGDYFNLQVNAKVTRANAAYLTIYLLDKHSKLLKTQGLLIPPSKQYQTRDLSVKIVKGTHYIQVLPVYISQQKSSDNTPVRFYYRDIKWNYSKFDLSKLNKYSINQLNLTNIYELVTRLSGNIHGLDKSHFGANAALAITIMGNILYALVFALLIYLVIRKLSPPPLKRLYARLGLSDKKDPALAASYFYLVVTCLYYLSDISIHLELDHSARYLFVTIPAIAIAAGAAFSFIEGFIARKIAKRSVLSLFYVIIAVCVAIQVWSIFARASFPHEATSRLYKLQRETYATIEKQTGWNFPTLAGKTAVLIYNQAANRYAYQVTQNDAYDLYRHKTYFNGSAHPNCGLIIYNPINKLSSIDKAVIQKTFAQPLGDFSIVSKERLKNGSYFIEYSRKNGRCFSTFSNRYVLSPMDRIMMQAYPHIALGQVKPIAKTLAPHERDFMLAFSNYRFKGSKEKVLVYLTLADQLQQGENKLNIAFYSNQLRGYSCNNGFFITAMMSHPQLTFTNNATKQKTVVPLAYDLVGEHAILAPLYVRNVNLAAGHYTVAFNTGMVHNIDKNLWPMKIQSTPVNLIVSKDFAWPAQTTNGQLANNTQHP